MKIKKLFPATGIITLLILLSAMLPKKDMLEIGASLPSADLEMLNIDNKKYTLNDLKGDNGLLVIFSCNTCPFVIGNGTKSEGWQNRYPEIGKMAAEMGVTFVLVNPNEAKRTAGDSFEDMQQQYKDQNYNGYYLLDTNSKLADEFGALTTPHVYLFNAELKLVYKGAIDDNVSRRAEVKQSYLKDALENLKKGEEINPATTRQLGCSIKRI